MTTGFPVPPTDSGPRRPAWRPWVAVALLVIVTGVSIVGWWRSEPSGRSDPRASSPIPRDDSSAHAPIGQRVRVRVVNTSGVSGLARRATLYLREFGYDVVDFGSGNADGSRTRIVVHTGHQQWGTRVQRALGVGVVSTDADSSRYVDITVFVGTDWRAPAETLSP